jgi:pimeloyl-ACP methyl ester carboxylesterase
VALGRRDRLDKAAIAAPTARLVRFAASDDLDLAGLLFEPKRESARAAIFIHGMGGSFESKRTNLLARAFTEAGIAFFAFNNRGSYVLRRNGGMANEVIRDGVHDIEGAIRELRRRGYRDITLIGHSTGANKIAVFDHYMDHYRRRNLAKRYVLLGGGDDTGLAYLHLGARRFTSALRQAREKRRSEELAPPALAPHVTTWRAFYDMANPDGDYNVFPFLEVMRGIRLSRRPRFRYLRAIRKPALVLYGDRDEYCHGDVSRCVSILADVVGPNFELAIMEDADHGFSGREEELARVIIDWMN